MLTFQTRDPDHENKITLVARRKIRAASAGDFFSFLVLL
jgi:hypothetical protein